MLSTPGPAITAFLSIIIIIIVGAVLYFGFFAQSRARQAVNLTRYSIRITI